MTGRDVWAATMAAVMVMVTGGALAAPPKPGGPMPDFSLKDVTDGKAWSLSALKGSVVVVTFCSQECPWSLATDKDLPKVAKDYEAKGVKFLSIDSGANTTPEQVAAYRAKAALPYPVLKDPGNAYADAVSAQHTPEVYVVDKDGVLRYHGAYDNRKSPDEAGSVNYVRQALDAVLAGQPVATAETSAWGCTIKRAPKAQQ